MSRLIVLGFLFGAWMLSAARAEDGRTTSWLFLLDPVMYAGAGWMIWRHRILPPWPAAAVSLAVAIAIPWSADPAATASMAAKVLVAGVAYRAVAARPQWRDAFLGGFLWATVFNAILLAPDLLDLRQGGLARSIPLLGVLGVAAAIGAALARNRWIWGLGAVSAAICLAAAGSRAPATTAAGMAATRGAQGLVTAAVIVTVFLVVVFQRGEGQRIISLLVIENDAITRAGTVQVDTGGSTVSPADLIERPVSGGVAGQPDAESQKQHLENYGRPAAEDVCVQGWHLGVAREPCQGGRFTLQGYGLSSYDRAAGWPRPHNVYALLVFEMGVLAIVPLGLFGWWGLREWRRRDGWMNGIYRLLPFGWVAAWGVLDEGMALPEGVPVFLLFALSIAWSGGAFRRKDGVSGS